MNEKIEQLNASADGAIDPWLVKWAKSPYSMAIVCAFGVAIFLIGFAFGNAF